MLDKKDFAKIAPEVRDEYRSHVFFKGKDVNDKSFPKYKNKKYEQLKSAGALPRQQGSVSAALTAPVVSTDLLRDFNKYDFKARNNGFSIGFIKSGKIVESLVKRGRLLTTKEKALPNGVAKFLDKEINKAIDKKLGGNTTTVHKIKK
tara:strand:- start:577 stop:1020 length:444 start_codon:yes stop_codon:yes gene_type:complete